MKAIYYCIAAILISSCCGNAREPKESESATIQQKQHDSIRDAFGQITELTAPVANELDLYKAKDGDKVRSELRIVEVDLLKLCK